MPDASNRADNQLPVSIERLIDGIGRHGAMTPQLAAECVREAGVRAEDLLPWADFDHPIEDSYGRRLVYDGGHFEIMVMSWIPGDFSAIHDHGGTQWGAVQCFGRAEHAVFELRDDLLSTRVRSVVGCGDVNAVDHYLIHQMGNRDQPPFNSLHLYGATEPEGAVTGDARLFDLFEGTIQFTDGGVFFCLPEDLITRRIDGPAADARTLLEHHREMRARITRILRGAGNDALRSKHRLLEQEIRTLESRAAARGQAESPAAKRATAKARV